MLRLFSLFLVRKMFDGFSHPEFFKWNATLLRSFVVCLGFLSGLALSANAQPEVSRLKQNKKVVLEEFTGIHCLHCPDGHKRANQLKDSREPGAVILINNHTGIYAVPSTSEPDFRTADGAAITQIWMMNVAMYPSAAVNRRLFAGRSALAVERGAWSQYADSILAQPSYVNLAVASWVDTSTRMLEVNVSGFYTANGKPTDRLTVMLLEDSVAGPQTGASAYYPEMIRPDGKYVHNHLLRKVLTEDPLGDVISETDSGTLFHRTLSYQIPASYNNTHPNLKNLRVAAFVAESRTDILTAAYCMVSTQTSTVVNLASASAMKIFPNPAHEYFFVEIADAWRTHLHLYVHDITGRKVGTYYLAPGKQQLHRISTAGWRTGIYFLLVEGQFGLSRSLLVQGR